MLVLKRKKNQTIMLGNDIEIVVTDIKGDTVKIGIKAPNSISIHRKEIYELIQKQNISASKPEIDNLDEALKFLNK